MPTVSEDYTISKYLKKIPKKIRREFQILMQELDKIKAFVECSPKFIVCV
jgi:hypothetical protein